MHKLHQFHSDKQRKLTAIEMFTGWVTLPRLINFTQAGYSYQEWHNIKIKILIKHTWDYLRHSREEEEIMLRPKIYLSQKNTLAALCLLWTFFMSVV